MGEPVYLCIDLKSFYASVECVDRGLDPFSDRLVVADPDRGPGTICLAVSPALKALGVPGRCRVRELPTGLDYVTARPRMRRYLQASAEVYGVYLRFVDAEDMHVYSVDECFIDAAPYCALYGMDARAFARALMEAVFDQTGICATAGIGTNLFLAKVALDVLAKHAPDNVGYLDEELFKQRIWFHVPITDIWGVGPATARRLARHGVRDLAGVASLPPATLRRELGASAEYLIDHAWGQEPCTIAQIRAYVPRARSMSRGQVLPRDYSREEARLVLRETVDDGALALVEHGLLTDRVSLGVGYSWSAGGRPRTGASRVLPARTSSGEALWERLSALFDQTTLSDVPVRRVGVSLGGLVPDRLSCAGLFDAADGALRERSLQRARLDVRARFGKNALLKGTSLLDGATARLRNEQVGGHHA